ncbi:MAG TPA: TIR domain-containing protein [Thermomonas sp.]|nr:TIR domain-containing protein [Thermomonas sp.]
MRYRAFISYSHADARWAAWLHRSLEGYRLPSRLRGSSGEHGPLPDRLLPIFRDRDDLSSAGELGPQIEAALAESEALVVVCSPNSARSPYVEAEILAFKRLGRGNRIYAFIIDGEPNAGDQRECFSPTLRHELDADGNIGPAPANPIAADARAGKDGKALARLKLLAGLFGLPLDTLRQREVHRRNVRMAAITGVAVLVMLVTSVLAVQAVIARKAAERRQKQAEVLVNFMLGDLNDKLSEVSRLDIMSSVNDKAMDYFQSLPKTDLTDESLAQRAKALAKIGSVRSELGEFDKAMQSFTAAADLSGSLARAASRDVARQLAYADVLAYIGTIHWYQGELDGAERSFDAAHAVLERARHFAPDNPELLFQLSTIDNNLGHVLEGRGRIQDATVNYQRMLEAAQRLAKLGPTNVEWQNQLGLAHNNLAKMALMRGDLALSIAEYRADEKIEADLFARDPRNNAQRERQLIARATLGRTLALAGELEEGAALTRMAVDEARQLGAMEPGSTAFQEDIGLYTTQLARMERLRGNLPEAAGLTRQSLAALRALTTTNPAQTGWQRELAEAYIEQAEQLTAAGGPGEASVALRAALAILEPLAKDAEDRSVVLAVTHARLRMSTLLPPADRAPLASQALAMIDGQASARADPRLQALRVEALLQLERRNEARRLAGDLTNGGYREAGFLKLLRSHGISVARHQPKQGRLP